MRIRLFDSVDSSSVEQREFHLAVFSLSIIAVLIAGIAALMYPSLSSHPPILSAGGLRIAFYGFCGLSVLLLGYLIDRQIVVRRLRREIRQAEKRYTELHQQTGKDWLETLSGLDHFQDRLTMEFRRAVSSRETLSVILICLKPTVNLSGHPQITAALGEAVKAMSRKLRPGDSLYNFSDGAFGIILPGVNKQNAQMVAARLAGGLNNAFGALDRLTQDVKIFNYPHDAATAHEMENAVRSLLPPEVVSESSILKSF